MISAWWDPWLHPKVHSSGGWDRRRPPWSSALWRRKRGFFSAFWMANGSDQQKHQASFYYTGCWFKKHNNWLVVSTSLKHISQLGGLETQDMESQKKTLPTIFGPNFPTYSQDISQTINQLLICSLRWTVDPTLIMTHPSAMPWAAELLLIGTLPWRPISLSIEDVPFKVKPSSYWGSVMERFLWQSMIPNLWISWWISNFSMIILWPFFLHGETKGHLGHRQAAYETSYITSWIIESSRDFRVISRLHKLAPQDTIQASLLS